MEWRDVGQGWLGFSIQPERLCSASTILAGFTDPMSPAFQQTVSSDNCHPHTR